MTENDAYSTLSQVFEDVFERAIPLSPDLTAEDVEDWDSFKQIEIIIALQEKCGIKFSVKQIDALKNVGDLAHLLVEKTTTP